MTNEVTLPPDGGFDNDGFAPSGNNSGRGHDFLRWKAGYGWVDRDGVTAPSPLLAVKVDEILRMWKDDRPTDITEKPLPDPDTLNAQIPVSEWEEGLDGRPRPPWAHYVVVYLVDPETATKYVYAAATVGGHIAVEQLKENVITMRIDLPEAKYPRPDNEISFHKRLKTRIESLPGVEASALASNLPSWGWMDFTSEVEGAPLDDRGQPPNVHGLVVSGNYFRAMQVSARHGRLSCSL